jgi:hypothetical protein
MPRRSDKKILTQSIPFFAATFLVIRQNQVASIPKNADSQFAVWLSAILGLNYFELIDVLGELCWPN